MSWNNRIFFFKKNYKLIIQRFCNMNCSLINQWLKEINWNNFWKRRKIGHRLLFLHHHQRIIRMIQNTNKKTKSWKRSLLHCKSKDQNSKSYQNRESSKLKNCEMILPREWRKWMIRVQICGNKNQSKNNSHNKNKQFLSPSINFK